jgi:hypothetical protein
VLTLAINFVAQKEEAAVKMLLVIGVRNPQSTACDVWSLLCGEDVASVKMLLVCGVLGRKSRGGCRLGDYGLKLKRGKTEVGQKVKRKRFF